MTMTIEELRSEEQHTQLDAIEARCLRDKIEELTKRNELLEKQIGLYEDLVSDIAVYIENKIKKLVKDLEKNAHTHS